jgi:hypothetical protein
VGDQRVHTKALTKPATGKRGKSAVSQALRAEELIPIRVTSDNFIVVRVSSATTIDRFFGRYGVVPLAFSNPIFVDVDADGHTPWSRP